MPHRPVALLALDLEVGDGREQHRVPVDEPLAAVDQALVVERDEGVGDDGREPLVHREVLVLPGHRVAHAAHLARDGRAARLLPVPDLVDELLAAEVVAAEARVLELALDDDLRGDAGVVGARHPQRVVAAACGGSAISASMIVCWNACPMCSVPVTFGGGSWMQNDGLRRVERRLVDAALFPERAPVRLDGGGVERLGELAFAHRSGTRMPRFGGAGLAAVAEQEQRVDAVRFERRGRGRSRTSRVPTLRLEARQAGARLRPAM